MAAPLNSIVELQRILHRLMDAESRLAGIPEWMQELHEEHSSHKAGIDAVHDEAERSARDRRAAETELEDAQGKLKHYQEQISRVSTQREYGALLKEIDTVKSQIATLEQQALEGLEEYEAAQKKLGELTEGFRDLDTRYQAELAKWEEEKPSVEESAERLRRQSEEVRDRVPRGIQVLFDRLFERYGGQALARVVQMEGGRGPRMWHCEVCNYRVRPQAVVEIRNHGALTQCDSCKRILYYEEAEAAAD